MSSPSKPVLLITPGRTGSTLLINVLNHLGGVFGGEVLGHEVFHKLGNGSAIQPSDLRVYPRVQQRGGKSVFADPTHPFHLPRTSHLYRDSFEVCCYRVNQTSAPPSRFRAFFHESGVVGCKMLANALQVGPLLDAATASGFAVILLVRDPTSLAASCRRAYFGHYESIADSTAVIDAYRQACAHYSHRGNLHLLEYRDLEEGGPRLRSLVAQLGLTWNNTRYQRAKQYRCSYAQRAGLSASASITKKW